MIPPADVLRHYPALPWQRCQFLGNRGGFSGAHLWRLQSAAGEFCLKEWPAGDLAADQLASIHGLLNSARRAGIDFVPNVTATTTGASVVIHDGRLWDLSTWLPGSADFHDRPSNARLAAAGEALARLHVAWQQVATRLDPCPVVARRLATLRRWRELLATGWQPTIAADDPVRPWAERAWQLLPRAVPEAERSLSVWLDVPLPLHAVWSDPWHDHVLFTGDRVTGLIDYGSVKEDHAAIDLARMLGSFVGADPAAWEVVFGAYTKVRPFTDRERVLVAVLEQAGLVNAVVAWLRWLYHDERVFENRDAVAKRLQTMVARLDNQAQLQIV